MSAASEPFRIAMVPGVTVTKWTRAWRERRGVPLQVTPIDTAEQVAVLHRGDADVSFVRLPVDREGLSVIRLYGEVPVVVVPKGHPVAELESVTLADIAAETTRPEPLPDAIDLVAAGVGVLLLPHSIARLHARKDLVAVPIADAPQTEIAIAWLTENTTPEIDEFVGIVRGRTAASSRGPATTPEEAKPKTKPARPTRRSGPPSRGKKPRGRR